MLHVQAGFRVNNRLTGGDAVPRSVFRGPLPEADAPYIAVLGGSSTYGKAVVRPYPDLVEAAMAVRVANLGVLNGGPGVYLSDPKILNFIVRAELAVVQLTGAETLSNPYYTVHSRRNDRLVAARPALLDLFSEVDLTDIHFARHLLQVLADTDADRFALVARALKANWVARMLDLLVHLPLRRRLLWLSDSAPPDRADSPYSGSGPLLVDAGMLARLRPLAGEVIVAVPSAEARASDAGISSLGPDGRIAVGLPGPMAHQEVATVLIREVSSALRTARPSPLVLRQTDAIR